MNCMVRTGMAVTALSLGFANALKSGGPPFPPSPGKAGSPPALGGGNANPDISQTPFVWGSHSDLAGSCMGVSLDTAPPMIWGICMAGSIQMTGRQIGQIRCHSQKTR